MVTASEQGEEDEEERAPWKRAASATEGKILLAGIVLACAYLAVVGLTRVWSPGRFHALWKMTVTHVLGGRAAGLSYGYNQDLGFWVVVGANMAIETFLLLFFYPLFVFSYDHLIVIRPLEDTIARARRAAKSNQPRVMKWGVPGLFLFVLFPFWMTGPLVGSIIGFLIGLRPLVNVSVVLAGTGVAIILWGLLLQRVH